MRSVELSPDYQLSAHFTKGGYLLVITRTSIIEIVLFDSYTTYTNFYIKHLFKLLIILVWCYQNRKVVVYKLLLL